MNSISIPVIHPAFEKLKNSGRLLHLIAALVLIAHAFSHMGEGFKAVYFWCLTIFAIDIILLVFSAKNLAVNLPRLNAFFRFAEFIFFIGIGLMMFLGSNWVQGAFHVLLSILYLYLFYCEKRLSRDEAVSLHHTGVTIPALPENKFLLWSQINHLKVQYDSIQIDTSYNKNLKYDFRNNISFDELDQIHEFCRHYLGEV